jgi:hypothetical protein
MSRRKRKSSVTNRRGAGDAASIQASDAMMDALQTIRRTSQFLAAACTVSALVMAYESYAAISAYLTPSESSGWEELIQQVSLDEGLRLTVVAFLIGFGWLAYLLFRYSLDVGRLMQDDAATLEHVFLLQKKLWHGLGLAAAFSLLTGLVVVVYFFVMS